MTDRRLAVSAWEALFRAQHEVFREISTDFSETDLTQAEYDVLLTVTRGDDATARLRDVTASLLQVADPVARLANASAYLEAFGHVTVAWIWLEQVLALGDRDDDFARGKRQAARYFMQWELPRVDAWLDRLADNDDTALAMRDDWF